MGTTGQMRVEAGGTLTITGDLRQTNARDLDFLQPGNVIIEGGIEQASARALLFNGTGTTTIGGNITTNTRTITAGTVILTGAVTNTTNATLVNGTNGALLVEGSHAAAVNLTAGRIGGNGSLGDTLSLASGAEFVFDMNKTLDVAGAVTLNNTFSISSLVNANGSAVDWSTVSIHTYSLIGLTSSNLSNIENFGFDNRATGLAGGREAYFTGLDGLSLVVVPEPSVGVLFGLGLGALVWLRRRRR